MVSVELQTSRDRDCIQFFTLSSAVTTRRSRIKHLGPKFTNTAEAGDSEKSSHQKEEVRRCKSNSRMQQKHTPRKDQEHLHDRKAISEDVAFEQAAMLPRLG